MAVVAVTSIFACIQEESGGSLTQSLIEKVKQHCRERFQTVEKFADEALM